MKEMLTVKGVLIGLTNPLAIPFWLAVTAYLQSMDWLSLPANSYLIYLAGISSGKFLLLMLLTVFGLSFLLFIRIN